MHPKETIDPYIMSLLAADADKKGIFYLVESVKTSIDDTPRADMYVPKGMTQTRVKSIIAGLINGVNKLTSEGHITME